MPYALRGSDSWNTTETARKAFRKFVSLIPESVKERLRPIMGRITEVLKE